MNIFSEVTDDEAGKLERIYEEYLQAIQTEDELLDFDTQLSIYQLDRPAYLRKVYMAICNLEAQEKMLAEVLSTWGKRKSTLKKRVARLKFAAQEALGDNERYTDDFVKYSNLEKVSCAIDDDVELEDLPERFVSRKLSLRVSDATLALEAGAEVPGLHLTRERTLRLSRPFKLKNDNNETPVEE